MIYFSMPSVVEMLKLSSDKTMAIDQKPKQITDRSIPPPKKHTETEIQSAQFHAQVPQKTAKELVTFLNRLEQINSVKNSLQVPPLCEIICKPSLFKVNKTDPQAPTTQFFSFFKNEQNRAFDDFNFRITLERVSSTARIVPDFAINFLLSLDNFDQISEYEKIRLSLIAPTILTRYIAYLDTIGKQQKQTEHFLQELSKLQSLCESTDPNS